MKKIHNNLKSYLIMNNKVRLLFLAVILSLSTAYYVDAAVIYQENAGSGNWASESQFLNTYTIIKDELQSSCEQSGTGSDKYGEWTLTSGSSSSPIFRTTDGNAMDWLISPEFFLIGGKSYTIAIYVTATCNFESGGMLSLGVHYGAINDIAGMSNTISSYNFTESGEDLAYSVNFTPSRSGFFHIGFLNMAQIEHEGDFAAINITSWSVTIPDPSIEGVFTLPFYNDLESVDMVFEFEDYWYTTSNTYDAVGMYGWWPTQYIGGYRELWENGFGLPLPSFIEDDNLNGFLTLFTSDDTYDWTRTSYLITPIMAIDETRPAKISFKYCGVDDYFTWEELNVYLCKSPTNNLSDIMNDPDAAIALIHDDLIYTVNALQWNYFEIVIDDYSLFSDATGYFSIIFENYDDNGYGLILDDVKVEYLPLATVTATAGANGTITPSIVKTGIGAIARFTVLPDPGYIIDQVTYNGSLATNVVATARTLSVMANYETNTLNVTFKERPTYNLPYVCNFNNFAQFGEWTIFDLNEDGISWVCYTANEYVRMSNWTPDGISQNDVLVTPPLNMIVGNTNAIRVKYRYRTGNDDYVPEKVKVLLTRESDVTSNTTTNAFTVADHTSINSVSWTVQETDITPAQLEALGDDDYLFLKFHCYSDGDKWYPYIDGVSITVIPNPTISAFATEEGGTISPSGDSQISYGASITYTITINTGYMIQAIFVDGSPVSNPTTTYTFTDVTSDHTIEVIFQKVPVSINASIGFPTTENGGNLVPNGVVSREYGDDQTFTFTPAVGWELDRVVVNGALTPTLDNTYTFYNITASSQSIEVFFKKQTYTISVSSGPNGTISPNGSFLRDYGESAVFTIAPESDEYEINMLTVNGLPIAIDRAATSYTLENISSNMTVNITFRRVTYSVNVSASGLGSVTPTGFITVNRGANLEFILTPLNQYYHVSRILLNDIEVPKSEYENNRFSINNIQNAYTLEIFFDAITYRLITSASGPGTISPLGSFALLKGEDVFIALSPNDQNKEPIALVVNGELIDYKDTVYLIDFIDNDYEIHAIFDEKSYTINAIADGGGVMTPVGNVRVYINENQTFNFEPWNGFQIDYVRVNGRLIELDAANSYTFRNVTANATIQVYFKQADPTAYLITSSVTNGTISPANGVAVTRGLSQKFTFEPDFGYELDVVRINGINRPEIRGNSYTFTNVTSNSSISVTYRIKRYTLDVQVNCVNGRISPDGLIQKDFKSTEVFRFIPAPGYVVDQVMVNGVEVLIYGNMLPIYVTENLTITATFKEKTGDLTIVSSAGNGGSISPNGTVDVVNGDNQIFAFIPDPGYAVEKVEVDGIITPYNETDNTYTFYNVKKYHTIYVSFVPTPVIGANNVTEQVNKFVLYPNPTSSVINLQGDLNEIETILVLDLAGSNVIEFNNISNQLDVSELPNGTYTIRILRKDRKIENYSVIKIR